MIGQATTYLHYGFYPWDAYENDEQEEQMVVDEEEFLLSIIDWEGYDVEMEGAIDMNEQLRRQPILDTNYDDFCEVGEVANAIAIIQTENSNHDLP